MEPTREPLTPIDHTKPDQKLVNPVGNITEADKELLLKKGISEAKYREMWEIPAIVKTTKEICLSEYEE